MRTFDQILREERLEKRRLNAARSAVALLTPKQRREFVVEIVDSIEAETVRKPASVAVSAVPAVPVKRGRGRPRIHPLVPVPVSTATPNRAPTKIDRAEALVMQRPGLNSAEIGAQIGQSRAAADCTLRQLMGKRGTVVRRDARWYPANGGGPDPGAN